MAVVRVRGFAPSESGFRFANDFPRIPLIRVPGTGIRLGDASRGLCGGMVFTVLDLHRAGVAPPTDASPPSDPGRLFRYLVRRSFDSFDLPFGPAKYYAWMVLPDGDAGSVVRGVWTRSLVYEWPKIRRDLDLGRPSPLGLVRVRSLDPMHLGLNHQVLAYGYDLGDAGELSIRVYDPNHPGEDGLAIRGNVMGRTAFGYVAREAPVRGFFRSAYRPSDPRLAF